MARIAHTGLTELHRVETMHERKAKMTDLADAFLALPGGIGTLDELFEAWSWNALGYHKKPFCLLNVDGYWDGMIEFINHATKSGCLSAQRREQLFDAQTAQHMIASDSKQERTERSSGRVKHMTVAHQEEEDFLRHVLGDGFRAAHLQSEPVDRGLAATIEKRECLFVSGQH